MPGVEVEGVCKRFGPRVVLDDVTFAVEAGEGICLFGPSGCGKTTLLRVVAGLERPDAGRVTLNGERVVGEGKWTPPERRGIGFVFQDFALWPHMRVEQHLEFVLRRRIPMRRERRARIDAMLDLVQLAGVRAARPARLSGGEQQRLAIARALVVEPSVLLLDEPFANLDSANAQRVKSSIMAAMQGCNVTVVLATHRREDAAGLASRIFPMGESVSE